MTPSSTRNPHASNHLKHGFTLLELSMVVGIISLVLGMSISSMKGIVATAKISATNTEMRIIEQALQSYWEMNGRLPCPAISSTSSEAAAYGNEAATPGTCVGVRSATGVKEGMLPFNTLNLPETLAEDGWNNRYTYAVVPEYTVAGSSLRYPSDVLCSGLTVNDDSGTARTTRAMYVLISHGANGYGATVSTGAVKASTNAGTDEDQNAHRGTVGALDTTFVLRTPEPRATTSALNFDDMVRYKERWELATEEEELFLSIPINMPQLFFSSSVSPWIFVYNWDGNSFEKQADVSWLPGNTIGGLAASGASNCFQYLFIANEGSAAATRMLRRVVNAFGNQAITLPSGGLTFNEGAFSPDSRFIAYSSTGGPRTQTIDASHNFTDATIGGTPISTATTSVAFSPNGSYLAAGTTSAGGALEFYKLKADGSAYDDTGITQPVVTGIGNVSGVAFSPNGKFLAVSHATAPYLKIYRMNYTTDTMSAVSSTLSDAIAGVPTSVAFSADSRYLAVGHATSPFITVYSVSSDATTLNKLADSADLPSNTVNDVSFSSQGLMLAAAVQAGSPPLILYEIRIDTNLIKMPNPTTLAADGTNGLAVQFSPR